jgi:hypothetical protein
LSTDNVKYLDVIGTPSNLPFAESKVMELMKLTNDDLTATALKHLKYWEKLTKAGKNDLVNTIWVIGDLNCPRTRKVLKSALDFMVILFYLLITYQQ